MRISDWSSDVCSSDLKTAPNKVLQEVGPEDLRFRGADMQADDLAPALGVDGHGDYCGNADDPPAFAYLEIGGIEPEIRPFAGERAFQKGMDALVNVLAKLGDGGLGEDRKSTRLNSSH